VNGSSQVNNIRIFEERPLGSDTMTPEMLHAQNYYQWTVDQFTDYLGDHILDIGGGYGSHLEFILPDHPRVISAELSEDSVAFMNRRFQNYPEFEAIQVDFGANDIQMLTSKNFDTITLFNVLEHIEDDFTALKDMHSVLAEQQGHLLIQVPAHMWLYGSLDEQAGHFRRYSKAYTADILKRSGFEIVKLYHFNVFGVLPWFINARILRQSLQASSVNTQVKIFNALIPYLRTLENIMNLPVGQSIIAIAKAK
jgi:ubiquinone/menaquinone biosynthesis C-methylase UbiE